MMWVCESHFFMSGAQTANSGMQLFKHTLVGHDKLSLCTGSDLQTKNMNSHMMFVEAHIQALHTLTFICGVVAYLALNEAAA